MLFSITDFLKDENEAIVTRSKDGKVIGTVVRLGELDHNNLPIINHNGNVSSVLFTVWQAPKQLSIGQSVRGNMFLLPFEKADGEIIKRNVITSESVSYDYENECFVDIATGEKIEEYINDKPNPLISGFVRLRDYYAETTTVETEPATASPKR